MPFYPTLAKAKAAAKKIIPKNERTSTGYYKHYKQDPNLPSAPNTYYAKLGWQGWRNFLGPVNGGFYHNLAEAMAAALKVIPENERTAKGYIKYCDLDPRLPRCPHSVYKNKGWRGWNHFFEKKDKDIYPSLKEAQEATLKIIPEKDQTQLGYRKHYKEDPRLPANPYQYYKDEWISWDHFFGTEKKSLYPTLHEAKLAVLKVVPENSRTSAGYKEHYKKDPRLPASPDSYYLRKGWKNWRHFYGLESRSIYPTLAQAQDAAIKLIPEEDHSVKGYKKHYKQDPCLPSNPSIFYAKGGWTTWGAFFKKTNSTYYSALSEAKIAAMKVIPKEEYSKKGYHQNCYKDKRLPGDPETFYLKKGWKEWANFFDVEIYPTLAEAMKAVLNIVPKGKYLQKGYQEYYHQDIRLPENPNEYYEKLGWQNWDHFFGKDKKKFYLTIDEAMVAAKRIVPKNDQNLPGYKRHYKEDPRLPAAPEKHYKGRGWKGVDHFFGKTDKPYSTLEQAMVAALEVVPREERSRRGYKQHYKKDPRLHSSPDQFYTKKGWQSWTHFLGCSPYSTLAEAMAATLRVIPENERSQSGYHQNYKKDPRLPHSPSRVYVNKGWISWFHFLGKEPNNNYASLVEAMTAAQKVIPKNEQNMDGYYKHHTLDPRLPSSPRIFYRGFGWQNWDHFYGRKNYYSSLSELKEAIKKNHPPEFWNKSGYKLAAKTDDRIPPNPKSLFYKDWISWENLFKMGEGKYETLTDASNAWKKLAKKNKIKPEAREYNKHYKLDPRLPARPDKYYSEEWSGWSDFFGFQKKRLYETVEEASQKAKDLGLDTYEMYKAKRHKDPMLPSEPVKYYGLTSYKNFIGFRFFNLEETRKYCIDKNITNITKYKSIAQNEPQLRVHYKRIPNLNKLSDILAPIDFYRNLKNMGFSQWCNFSHEWVKKGRNIDNKSTIIRKFLEFALEAGQLPKEPGVFFYLRTPNPDLDTFIETLPLSQQKQSSANIIIDYCQYVMEESCYDIDPETGVATPINENQYINPYSKQIINYNSQHRPNESVKPPLPMDCILNCRNYLIPQFIQYKGSEISCTTFRQLKASQNLYYKDWFDVEEKTIDKNDPNCVYRCIERYKENSGRNKETVWQMWSPVKTIAMYCLVTIPLRGIQITYLDSGEADCDKLEIEDGELIWVKNDNPLAEQNFSNRKYRDCGFLRRGEDDSVGMRISTNKTSSYEGGYEIAYIPEELAPWIIRLRNWQTLYNPINKPTAWVDIKHTRKINSKLLSRRGTQCFLFRDPTGKTDYLDTLPTEQPISTSATFSYPLPKLLYSVQKTDLPLAEKAGAGETLGCYRSKYTPHGMRVSLITALIADANISPVIVAKLVGHSNIVMTIYYVKLTQKHIRETLDNGYEVALAKAPERAQALILEGKIKEAESELLFTDSNLMLKDPDWPAASIKFFDYGVCPVAGNLCHEGGDLREEGGSTVSRYNPVTAGYLGRANCFRCRFFLTGPAFIGGLKTFFQEINAAKYHSKNQLDHYREQQERLEAEEYMAEKSGIPFDNSKVLKLRRIESHIQTESERLDNLVVDQVRLIRLVTDSLKIINDSNDNDGEFKTTQTALVLNTPEKELSIAIDECSTAQMLGEICQNTDLYVSANATAAITSRSQLLDKLAHNNGLEACLFTLTESQQLKVGNQIQALLLKRLGGWGAVNQLHDGAATLNDFSINDTNLTRLREDIQDLMQSQNLQTLPAYGVNKKSIFSEASEIKKQPEDEDFKA